jgi:hypothetical protein
MHDKDKENELQIKGIFAEAQKTELAPSAFLKTRILANIRGLQMEKQNRIFKRFAFAAPIAAIILVLLIIFIPESGMQIMTNQNVLVKIEIKEIGSLDIAYAEIDLPDGVTFYSVRHPEINSQQNITIAWTPQTETSKLPFIINAKTAGKKAIKIKFFDDNNNLVKEKSLNINFRANS